MHALLAHAYHLALLPIHLGLRPVWRPLGACLVLALVGRLLDVTRRPRGAAVLAGVAVLAGWLMQAPPTGWPPTPVARLPGLALVVLAQIVLADAGRRSSWGVTLAGAALGGWWLRGASLSATGIAYCVPVILGLQAAFWAACRLVRSDRGWGTAYAAASLAASLWLAGAAPHWVWAALVPAVAALAMAGLPEAMPVLAGMIVMVAGSALVASDRGRLIPVDVACLVPLLVWLVPPRVGRFGAPVAGMLAALAGVVLVWTVRRVVAGW